MELPIVEIQQQSPLEICQAQALDEYGIADASPVRLLTSIAWNEGNKLSDRMRAAVALLPYCHQPFKAAEMINPNSGPELLVSVLGVVQMPAPGVAGGFAPVREERVINEQPDIHPE